MINLTHDLFAEKFKLELLPDGLDEIASSKNEIIGRARTFRQDYLANYPEILADDELAEFFSEERININTSDFLRDHLQKVHYQRLASLFRDLEDGRFWGTLRLLDGSVPKEDYLLIGRMGDEKAQTDGVLAKRWAKQAFSGDELQELLTVCINQAILIPSNLSAPGIYRGHSILFEEFVEKKNSLFRGIVDLPFLRRLVNGSFWETLPNMNGPMDGGLHYNIVDNILTDYKDFLDIEFVDQGVRILNRRRDRKPRFDLRGLSLEAVDYYVDFVKEIHGKKEALEISDSDLRSLVRPYVMKVIRYEEDPECYDDVKLGPVFSGIKSKGFAERLKEKWLIPYLEYSAKEYSGSIREELAKDVASYAIGEYSAEHAIQVIHCMPSPEDFLGAVLLHMNDYSRGKFAEEWGDSFEHFLTETTRVLVDGGKKAYRKMVKRELRTVIEQSRKSVL